MKKVILAIFVCIIVEFPSLSFASPTFIYDGFTETTKSQFVKYYNDMSPFIESILGNSAKSNDVITLHYKASDIIGWDRNMTNLYIPPTSDGSLNYIFLTIEMSLLWLPTVYDGLDSMLYRLNEYTAHAVTAFVATNMKQQGFSYFDSFAGDMSRIAKKIEITNNPTGEGSFRETLNTIKARNVFQLNNNYDINGFCCDVGSILHMTLYKLDNNYFKNFIAKWLSHAPWSSQTDLINDIVSSCAASKINDTETVENWVKADPIFNKIYDNNDIGIDIVATSDTRLDISTKLNPIHNSYCILGFSDKKSYLNPEGIPVYDIRKDEDFFNKPVNITITNLQNGSKSKFDSYVWNTKSNLDNEMDQIKLDAGTYKIEASMNIYDTVISDELIVTVKSLAPTVAPTVLGGSGGGGCNMNYNIIAVFLLLFPIFIIKLK